MGVSRTRTVKNKHAAKNSGISGSKSARKPQSDGVLKSKKPKGSNPATQIKGRPTISTLMKKRKKRVYTEKELDIPKLNTITPVGVQKPKGKKKGKVFVDDRVSDPPSQPPLILAVSRVIVLIVALQESMSTILSIVQAEKEGQIESKMIKARQMEEIREARRAEAEKKEAERQEKFDKTKESLRRKRKRTTGDDNGDVKAFSAMGSKAAKPRKKKVAFAE